MPMFTREQMTGSSRGRSWVGRFFARKVRVDVYVGDSSLYVFFFFQAEDGIRDHCVTGVQTCALPIYDEDLAALAVRAAAGGVVAAPGAGAGRVHSERPAFLHRGDVPQPLERGCDVGNDLVDAGDEEEPARAEGVSGDAIAAAVRVDDLAR